MMMHKAHVLGKVGHMLPTMAAHFPEIATKVNTLFILIISVADPVHFDTAPDPRIRFTEKRIRIRPKIFDQVSTKLAKPSVIFWP